MNLAFFCGRASLEVRVSKKKNVFKNGKKEDWILQNRNSARRRIVYL